MKIKIVAKRKTKLTCSSIRDLISSILNFFSLKLVNIIKLMSKDVSTAIFYGTWKQILTNIDDQKIVVNLVHVDLTTSICQKPFLNL